MFILIQVLTDTIQLYEIIQACLTMTWCLVYICICLLFC